VRPSINVVVTACVAAALHAGPREFGESEFRAALAARNLARERIRLRLELNQDRPQSWRIEATRISGGDMAGLMYGLLEAADQMRATGRLAQAKGEPAIAIRGVRVRLPGPLPAELNADWRSFLEILARARFNRIRILANPMPEEFVRTLAQAAAEYAIELEPRLWRPPLPEAVAREPEPYEIPSPVEGFGLPWGDPIHARRRIQTAILAGHDGIEIDAALPAAAHWFFYQLWGRLAYDPKRKDKALQGEFERRYSKSAGDVWEVITSASRALSLRSAAEPFFASADEAASIRAGDLTSAKLTPLALAAELHGYAHQAQQALGKIADQDLRTELGKLITAARMEARRLTAEDFAGMFRLTGSDSALRAARLQSAAAKRLAGELNLEAAVPVLAGESARNQDLLHYPPSPVRPDLGHTPPLLLLAGQPVTLSLHLSPNTGIAVVRLHYADKPGGRFQTLEASGTRPSFTFRPQQSAIYYFEVIHQNRSGWFLPDPLGDQPYFHLRVKERPIEPPQP
jgi:hypothetical protein